MDSVLSEPALKPALKQLIIDECDLDFDIDDITDDEPLIGSDCRLGLDSLDALSIALAVKSRYGKRIDGNNKTRMALASINQLAAFILAK